MTMGMEQAFTQREVMEALAHVTEDLRKQLVSRVKAHRKRAESHGQWDSTYAQGFANGSASAVNAVIDRLQIDLLSYVQLEAELYPVDPKRALGGRRRKAQSETGFAKGGF